MRIPAKRCPSCGTQIPAREIADDEACACGSRACLLHSAQVCITTHQNRPRTLHREDKGLDGPPRNRMLAGPAVKK